jgi:hypothetical protein
VCLCVGDKNRIYKFENWNTVFVEILLFYFFLRIFSRFNTQHNWSVCSVGICAAAYYIKLAIKSNNFHTHIHTRLYIWIFFVTEPVSYVLVFKILYDCNLPYAIIKFRCLLNMTRSKLQLVLFFFLFSCNF